ALQWGTMNTIGFHAQIGLMDYGILNTLQVDQYGNINSTAIGDYEGEHRRFGGPGGADSIAALCWRTILLTDQQRRKFVPRVDFISSAGFLDGSPAARERAGLPRGTGPWRVVTPWAVFDYDENRRLRLMAASPFVTVDQVLEEMDFQPAMADEIGTVDTPTEEELLILRTELDVRGQITDVGRWIELRDDEFVFADVGKGGDASLPRSW
ncbi:MAG: CoA-transferase, partial [Chloroflexota bacterium]|nr:CoA-transferase [Chloroflexota bacterium]